MRRFTTVVLVSIVALAVPTISAGEEDQPVQQGQVTEQTQPEKPRCIRTQKLYFRTLNRYVRYTHRNYDYRAFPVSKKRMKRLRHMRGCAASNKAHARMMAATRTRTKAWRFHRLIDQITPYGPWAIPQYIVMRESHGNLCARNPKSTAGGFYQFLDGTWYSYGGRNYGGDDHPAACAPAWHQHIVAARAWNGGAGSSHWALTR